MSIVNANGYLTRSAPTPKWRGCQQWNAKKHRFCKAPRIKGQKHCEKHS